MRKAILIALGDELLSGVRAEGNCRRLAKRLTMAGWKVTRIEILPDGTNALEEVLAGSVGRTDLVVVSGGLGPTHDDCTRKALARFLGVPLRTEMEAYERILARYPAEMMENLRRCLDTQGSVPLGTRPVHNPVGSALGIFFDRDGTKVYSFPGVPAEFDAMVEQELKSELTPDERSMTSVVVAGWAEGVLKDRIKELTEDPSLHTSILPSAGTVELVFRGDRGRIGEATARVRALFPGDCLKEGANSVAEDLLSMARSHAITISCAESCTGGLVGAALTDVPGSSAAFLGSAVCYSNEAKIRVLEVPDDVLKEHGAVSRECALYMARGARRCFNSTVAVAITGVAGPGGGSDDKPLGTVWFAVAAPDCECTYKHQFPGGREQVRIWAKNRALYYLRKTLMKISGDD